MLTPVTVTHLEMRSPVALRPRERPHPEAKVALVPFAMPELNRFFYTAIGGDWYWLERLAWSYQVWLDYVQRPEFQTWVVSMAGVPAGYFELEKQAGGDVEIVYFGLLPQFTEAGLGGWALSEAARCAWKMGANRVWVHTCDLDHPRALANYLARGFTVFKTEVKEEELPERTVGPWPGSGKAIQSIGEILRLARK